MDGDIDRLYQLIRDPGDDGVFASSLSTVQISYLRQALARHDGNEAAAAYEILIEKAQSTAVTLGDMTLADQAKYWLRRAALVRKNAGRALDRADAPNGSD